jgi:hypothetical protein
MTPNYVTIIITNPCLALIYNSEDKKTKNHSNNVQMYVIIFTIIIRWNEYLLFYEKRKMIIAIYNLQHTVSYQKRVHSTRSRM